jgi:hypothetical protein
MVKQNLKINEKMVEIKSYGWNSGGRQKGYFSYSF